MKHNRSRISVIPEIFQFIGGVAIVRIYWHVGGLEGCKHRLHIFRAVVEILRYRLLAFKPSVDEVLRNAVCSSIDVTPRESAVTVNETVLIRNVIRNALPDIGEIPVPHVVTPWSRRRPRRLSTDRSKITALT